MDEDLRWFSGFRLWRVRQGFELQLDCLGFKVCGAGSAEGRVHFARRRLAGHGFSDSYYQYAGNRDPRGLYEFIDKTITFLTQRIREQFPHIPIYPALGNEDSYCGDYQLQPKGEFLRRTAETWKGLLHDANDEQAFMQSFPTGGYYAASAPGTFKHRVVILNTVFFSTDYRNQCGDPKDDPGGDQLRWLAARLEDAANKGDKVWLLYHIPYGIDAYNSVIAPDGNTVEKVVSLWQPGYTEKFLALLDQYRDTIQSMLAGHTHMDYFRLGPYGVTGRPSTFLLVTPGISPIFGNNALLSRVRVRRDRGCGHRNVHG